ncbi:MAG: transglutaminase domain-containing protein [Acidobacteria bacterium]|nr:transglutaminase domain-containing protein [Acidobacteriota bacterium]
MFSKRLFRRDKMNLVLQQGKVFINYESPYEWETMPQIRIRPIDGNQQVPIRLRASFSSAWNSGHEPTFLVYLRLPAVLQPQLRIRQVLWGNRPATYNLAEDDAEPGHYILHIEGNESLKKSSPPDLFVQGLIKLDSYPGPFGDAFEPITGERADIARWSSLARPVPGRDYATSDELEIMEGLADRLLKDDSDPMAMIRSVADFLRERIKPFTNTMTRTPLQILTEKTGDEDDLCAIMAAFLRIRGIPCQVMARERYDFQSLHPGTWLEVYLPLRDGDGRWIIVDPLHVDRSEKDAPTLHRAREYIYSLSIIPTLLNYQGLVTSEILIGGEMAENSTEDELSSSADIHAAWDRFRAQTDQVTADFVNSGIQTRREFQFALGSAHLFVSRPVSGELPALQQMDDPDYIFNFDATPESVRSLWQVKIGPKDDLILEIGVTDEDYDLENMENRLLINRMEAVMREIGDKLLDGKTLLDLLEFSFYRDKYSDRLQKVSLRLSRVLVRNHAPQVIRILERNELLTASEGKKILRFVNITNGRNMYYMLEQARYVKRKIPAEEESPDDID